MEQITYKTESKQAILNFVVGKLLEQGGPSLAGAQCVYRAPVTGRKCAFGWLIPDDEYNERMEGNTLKVADGKLSHNFDLVVPEANRLLIRGLQIAHDNSQKIEPSVTRSWDLKVFEARFMQVACMFDLETYMIWQGVADAKALEKRDSSSN